MNIAIDGPAGAGKSTIAKRLAAKIGFVYLDTGAMYRAVALKMHNENIPLDDAAEAERILQETSVVVRYEDGTQKILLDGVDVSDAIREHFVSQAASAVSALPCVRLKMVELQRAAARDANVILDGRDIGTFVLPDAERKFFLTASIEERAKRRYEELCAKGATCSLEAIREDIRVRDYNDTHRTLAPLRKAEDAVEIDTTAMSVEQVVESMMWYIEE